MADAQDPHLRHLFDGTDNNVYSEGVLNLSVGAPGPDLLRACGDLFQEATRHCLKNDKEMSYLFQYGMATGMWEFREQLASFLTRQYGDMVRRENLVQTCGASHGLHLAMTEFIWPNSVIFVEDATYMLALQAFKKYPFMDVVPVPMTDDGLDADALEIIVNTQYSKRKWELTEERPFWAMLYTIPVFQNPTGVTMKESICQKVVDIARKYDILVLCEDVYNLLNYNDGTPPKRLFAYDFETYGYKGGHVISNGSFSKILAPGVRLGWMELPPRLTAIMRKSGILVSGGATNHYVSGIVKSLIELGLQERYLSNAREIFKSRMAVLCHVLDAHLPNGCTFQRPMGGFFVWIKLPEFVNALEFTNWSAEKHRVTVIHGSRFSTENKYTNYIRVGIAFHSKEVIEHAGQILCLAIKEYIEKYSNLL